MVIAGILSICLSLAQSPQDFTLSPLGADEAKLGYFPVPIKLSADKPAGITKEPAYRGKPYYGTIQVGNGPKSVCLVAVDEAADGDWVVYVDKGHSGDLTAADDAMTLSRKESNGRIQYGVGKLELTASYGTASEEKSTSPYVLGVYAFGGRTDIFCYRRSARIGSVAVDGKVHKAILVENDANALFSKPASSLEDAKKSRPVWLLIDVKDDGKWASGPLDIRAPFSFDDKAYEVKVSDDGAQVSLEKTTKPVIELAPKQPAAPPLLPAGSMAPDFSAEKWGGGSLKLSDYRGKVVVLDFWATWCGPCQKSMPHIEQVRKMTADKNVVVLGICVWDEQKAYAEWVPKNNAKYGCQFAFDKAGTDIPTSIAAKLYKVSGIPTTYVIGPDGKIVDSILGYDDGDTRVEDALKKAGVKL